MNVPRGGIVKIKLWLVVALMVVSAAFAQSVEVKLAGVSMADAQAKAEAALKGQGLSVARVLNLGGQVKNFKADFHDYLLMIVAPEEGSVKAVARNPMAAIVLPPTVYIHSANKGTTTVGTLDGMMMGGMLGLSDPETQTLWKKLEGALSSLGKMDRIAPAMMPDPKSGMMPALMYKVDGAKVEEVALLLESELASNGLNVLPAVKIGNVVGIHPCKSEWAYEMFMAQPAGGFAAPCRFFAMQLPDGVLVGAIEPMLMSIMPGVAQNNKAMGMLQEARRVMVQIIEGVGGKPYRPQ
jgi:uncharacterized protein (DUF302 family)